MKTKFHFMYLPNVIECKILEINIKNGSAKFDVIFKFKLKDSNKNAEWKQMNLSLSLNLKLKYYMMEKSTWISLVLPFREKSKKKVEKKIIVTNLKKEKVRKRKKPRL